MTLTADRLRAHLITTGVITESGVSRAAKLRACTHCGHPVIRALDGDVLAFDVSCDPDPIDPLGEVLALAAGRRTYDAIPTKTRLELEPRHPAHITGPHRYPVLAEHRCGQPLPAAADRAQRQETDEPPY